MPSASRVTIASRSGADVTDRVPVFCHGIVGRHQQHSVEIQFPKGRRGGDDMANVGRVEGSTEDPDPLRGRMHGGGF